jgi:hypothetical protein
MPVDQDMMPPPMSRTNKGRPETILIPRPLQIRKIKLTTMKKTEEAKHYKHFPSRSRPTEYHRQDAFSDPDRELVDNFLAELRGASKKGDDGDETAVLSPSIVDEAETGLSNMDFDDPLLPTDICHICYYRERHERRRLSDVTLQERQRSIGEQVTYWQIFFDLGPDHPLQYLGKEPSDRVGESPVKHSDAADITRTAAGFWDYVRSKLAIEDEDEDDGEPEMRMPQAVGFAPNPLRLSHLRTVKNEW